MKKIVVIHLSRMGDMLQSIPFLASLKKRFPNSHISLLAYRHFVKIISSSSYIDKFIDIVDDKYLKAFENDSMDEHLCLSFINNSECLKFKYDLLFNLTHNNSSALLSSYINAKEKAGALLVDKELVVKNDWCKYFFALSNKREENLFNIVDIYQGISGGKSTSFVKYYNDNFLKRGKDFLKNYHFAKDEGKIIAIQTGANLASKQWGKDNFLKLIELIKLNFKVVIILLGSKSEQKIGEYIESKIGSKIFNFIGRTEIEDLPGIIQDVDLLISSDSGLSHIAASAGVKTVTISFGAVYFAETSPYGDNNIILTPEITCYPCRVACQDIECKSMIDAESVLHAVKISLFEEVYIESKNVSAYITKLDQNSIIYYYPLNKNISDNFIKGVINQDLWSIFFNIKKSYDFCDFTLNKYGNSKQVMEIIDSYIRFYKAMSAKYKLLIKIINNYLFCKDISLKNDLQRSLNSFLKKFEEEIILSDESIFKYFHRYEMIDFPQSFNVDILQVALEKYSKLESIASLFIHSLQNRKINLTE